ncbi:GNAT family N-acetyltransferase [Streptomyces sp. VRA16 Mangrove soil]|uniref:GNAT family N-acetyltransferase n=1 Tax=Streptomyces sp. VRA16 Mangrove soil TaxID=2817434 RepID=UPI001A9FD405|nr:GNAT family N-acetyltransferase [Streptomyces sp. VRA16 Mangrove soil]MBO1337402.1 GNAT family N-acetyltransferase [Streptomyces sp. VRA16 Mangrove soil]
MTGDASGAVVTVCADPAEFGALRAEWNRLHAASPTATPFQSHAWLHSWWLSYGSTGRLCVVLVRREGRLVAAAPLMRRLRPFPVLTPLGAGISDFSDVLVDAAADGAAGGTGCRAVDALGAGLWKLAGTAVIDLREVRPGSAAEGIHDNWPGLRRGFDDSACLELPVLPMDDLVGRLPRPRAQRARAKMRKLDAAGIERRVVPAPEAGASVRRLLDLHQLQWQERRVTTEHMKPRFAEHLSRSVALMAQTGDAVVTEFTLDGSVVAADLTFVSPRLAGGYLYGAHPQLRERKIDVATMLLRSCTEHLQNGRRAEVLSLLRGTEPYKMHWRPEHVVNRRLLLARAGSAPQFTALVTAVRARSRAKQVRRAWKERGGDPA